jgi:Protein kinase domain
MVPELARDADFRTRLIREARAAATLGHRHVIPVFEADEPGGILYVAMHYVRGGDARSLLSQPGPLPPGYAGQIIAQIASALDAHARGLSHRDVRPANILLDGDAGDAATGDHAYAQIYADPPAVSARRAGLPAAMDSVLATALAKDPADRYPSCGRFAEELRAALGVRPGERSGPVRPRQAPAVAGDRSAVAGDRPAVAGDRPAVLRDRTALLEERSAARPLPLVRGAADAPYAADPGPPEPRRRALRLALAAAAVVVVIIAAVVGVTLSKRSAPAQSTASSPAGRSPSPTSTAVSATSSPSGTVLAAQQAAALGTLLTSSAAARTALRQAVAQVGACANLPAAVSKLQDVVNQRSSEYGRASALATAVLPDGATVKSALVAALGSSLKADQDFLAWARQQQSSGCTPATQSSAYNAR